MIGPFGFMLAPLSDAEFDALHGGRELLPIEQLAYEREGAERFAKFHTGRGAIKARAEHWGEFPKHESEPS